jgi:hypothetical protein
LPAQLLGLDPAQYPAGRMTYDLRRLRLHGLIERIPKSHRYDITPQDCVLLCSFREPTRAYCVQNSRRSCPVVHPEAPLFGPPLIAFSLRLTVAARRKNSSPEKNLTYLHYNLLGKNSSHLRKRSGFDLRAERRGRGSGAGEERWQARFVAFTGHKYPSIHLKMLSHGFPFDTVQMPLNCFDATFRSFGQQVLPEAARQGIAALGMKSMGGSGEMVSRGGVTAAKALRYAMSLPAAVTIRGMDSVAVLKQNLEVAR